MRKLREITIHDNENIFPTKRFNVTVLHIVVVMLEETEILVILCQLRAIGSHCHWLPVGAHCHRSQIGLHYLVVPLPCYIVSSFLLRCMSHVSWADPGNVLWSQTVGLQLKNTQFLPRMKTVDGCEGKWPLKEVAAASVE